MRKWIEKETMKGKDRQKKKYSVLLNRKGVSMCVSETESEQEKEKLYEKEKKRKDVCVCLCV